MPRGGRRPGAGAPKGNTNAMKHGRNSAHLRAVLTALAQVPEVREFFLNVQRRQARQARRAERAARKALREILRGAVAMDNPFIAYLVLRPPEIYQTSVPAGQATATPQSKKRQSVNQ